MRGRDVPSDGRRVPSDTVCQVGHDAAHPLEGQGAPLLHLLCPDVKPHLRDTQVRARFFSALKTLPLEDARFFSSSWPSVGRFTPAPANQAGSDTGALVDLLQHCTTLKTLGLTGYSSQPRILSTALMERAPCPLPTYQLRELNLVSCDLSGPAPLWLLGFSVFSLKTLNIAACTGLTRGVLERLFIIVGHTLKSLHLAIDLEDLADDSSSRSLEDSVLLPFTELTDFSCSTDSLFGDEVLSTLVTLPRMERITLCFPSFSSAAVLRAFSTVPLVAPPRERGQGKGPRAKRLKHLTLDAWESHELWDEPQRWAVSQASEARGVELLLNGASRGEIEEGALSPCSRTLRCRACCSRRFLLLPRLVRRGPRRNVAHARTAEEDSARRGLVK